jgi:hypothetical protein
MIVTYYTNKKDMKNKKDINILCTLVYNLISHEDSNYFYF